MIIMVVGTIIGITLALTSAAGRDTQGNLAMQGAISMGDGALDYMYAQWRDIARNSPNFAPTTSEFTAIPAPTSGNFPDMANCTLKNFGVTAVDPLLQPLATTLTVPPKQTGRGPGTYSYNYLATADVEAKSAGRTVTQKVRRVFQKKIQSPWNFAVFYQDTLEFQPVSALTLTGWVHTNGDLYTGTSFLTLTDRITTAETWNVGYAPGDSAHTATPTSPIYPANAPPAQESSFQPLGLDPTLLSKTDSNPNNDSFKELVESAVSGQSDPFAGQRFKDQAGIKVICNAFGKFVYNQSGQLVSSASTGNDYKVWLAGSSAVTGSTQSFQDNREGTTVSAWKVDINQLNSNSTGLVWNNIFYMSDTSSTGKAIRLVNGSKLPTGGLTFATDNPLYIRGDWNTGPSPPSSNGSTPDPTQPLDPTYTWRPSAIIADAVTLQSNWWVDSASTKSIAGRPAQNTTVNSAIITGHVPTGGGNYSGGAENLVRLMEDWTGKTFTYYGSMMQLYSSTQGTGIWGKANVYTAGGRKWYFDDKLILTPPPGSITLISYLKHVWYQE
jgi:hypothetical protein